MNSGSPAPGAATEYDPVFLNSRREAIVTLAIWALSLAWVVPYCYFTGYVQDGNEFKPEQLQTVLGMPSWAFWGIAVPWVVANIVTAWFAFVYMADDDLGEVHEGLDIEEEIAEISAHDRKA